MLGGTGENKGSKVSRDESFDREPGLRAALAYEAIYGKRMPKSSTALRQVAGCCFPMNKSNMLQCPFFPPDGRA
jgi:hypothetical protein